VPSGKSDPQRSWHSELDCRRLAVQVHGYPRFTVDADIVVPDLVAAHQVLLAHGYSPSLRVATGVIDPQTKVRIDLLPGGGSLTPRCPVNFPMPSELAGVYISLPDLIGVKLAVSCQTQCGVQRTKPM